MVELENITQAERDRIETLRGADIVIGLLAPGKPTDLPTALGKVRDALTHLRNDLRAVVIHPGDHIDAPEQQDGPRTLAYPLLGAGPSPDPAQSITEAFFALFTVSQNLGARVVAAIVSDLDSVTPRWFYHLLQPVLELDFDLVAPCYDHQPLEGLLNSSIVAPLTSALYGKQIQHPLGPDFGFSSRFLHNFLTAPAGARPAQHTRSLASLAVHAICGGFEICQVHVGVRRYPAPDWMNQSSVLAQVLEPVFAEAEEHAAFWQRIRGSQVIPVFGAPEPVPDAQQSLDIRRMIESFQLGWRNLQEIWGMVLPPGSLLQLTKLARSPLEQFRMPDPLWAHVIYDFALGHRLRLLSQEHLLRAMTPLYLAWVASCALEIGPGGRAAFAQRLDRLMLAFEATKPYAVSRWRWPDRFNP